MADWEGRERAYAGERDRRQNDARDYSLSEGELRAANAALQAANSQLQQQLLAETHTRQQLQELLEAGEAAILILDRSLCIRSYSRSIAGLFNILPGYRGRHIGDLSSRLDYDALLTDAQQVLDDQLPVEREVSDDQARDYLLRLRRHYDQNEQVDGVVVTLLDVTRIKQAENALREWASNLEINVEARTAALRESEARYRNLFEAMGEGMTVAELIYDDAGRAVDCLVIDANAGFERQTGRRREDVIGRCVTEYSAVVRRGHPWFARYGEVVRSGRPRRWVDYEPAQDAWFEVYVYPLAGKDRFATIFRNVTERKRVEEALRASEERFRALVDAAAQAVWTADANGHTFEDSPSWRAFTGQTREETVGEGWLDAVHPDDREQAAAHWARAVATRQPLDNRFRVRHAGGGWRWVRTRAAPLFDEAGEIRGWVGMNSDITEQVQAEQDVRDLAAQLTLAEHEERRRVAQILHDDLQQQLYSLQLRLNMLGQDQQDVAQKQALGELEAEVSEAIETTRRLSVSLSPPLLQGEGLTEALGWLAHQTERQYRVQVELQANGACPVPDEDRRVLLFQIVREMIFNAVKHAGVDKITVRLQRANGHYRIDVVDRGSGFDPQQAIAQAGAMTGRGLLTARERLRFIGGDLHITSAPGQGTTVTVLAPVV